MQPLAKQPAYIEVQAELAGLNEALVKIDRRIEELDASIGADEHQSHRRQDGLADAGLHFAKTGVPLKPEALVFSLREERAALGPQREALARRIAQRVSAADAVAGELSVQASALLRPRHRAILGKLAAALRKVDQAVQEEADLLEELRAAGYGQGASHFQVRAYDPRWGRAAERDSMLWRRLRELDYAGDAQ